MQSKCHLSSGSLLIGYTVSIQCNACSPLLRTGKPCMFTKPNGHRSRAAVHMTSHWLAWVKQAGAPVPHGHGIQGDIVHPASSLVPATCLQACKCYCTERDLVSGTLISHRRSMPCSAVCCNAIQRSVHRHDAIRGAAMSGKASLAWPEVKVQPNMG